MAATDRGSRCESFDFLFLSFPLQLFHFAASASTKPENDQRFSFTKHSHDNFSKVFRMCHMTVAVCPLHSPGHHVQEHRAVQQVPPRLRPGLQD